MPSPTILAAENLGKAFGAHTVLSQIDLVEAPMRALRQPRDQAVALAERLLAKVGMSDKEAAQVLGLSPLQSFMRIVAPQAVRTVLPPLAANFVQLIKYSSLAAVIAVGEVTRRGLELSSSMFRPLEMFSFVAVVYFAICWPLSQAVRYREARLARR